MKNLFSKLSVVLVVCMTAMFNFHCSHKEVSLEDTSLTFLVDVTDTTLFEQVNSDFHQNLPVFFERTGLDNIQAGQKLTLKMSPITCTGVFSMKQASIALPVRDMSKREEAMLRNPEPLMALIRSELDDYAKMAADDQQSSPILDVMLKSFREMSPTSSQEMLVVFTDGYEHSNYLNMYKAKTIPTSEMDVARILEKTDQILLQDARSVVKNVNPAVVFVLKETSKANSFKRGDLKMYYTELLRQIGVTEVVFIDNLTNTPNL